MEIEGRLLLFDVVHPDGSFIPSDCKIDIPEKVPIEDEFNHNKCLGQATVSKDEKGLIFTGEVFDGDFITDFYSGCGGYFTNVTSEPSTQRFLSPFYIPHKRKITNMALKAVGLLKNKFINEYTFKKRRRR